MMMMSSILHHQNWINEPFQAHQYHHNNQFFSPTPTEQVQPDGEESPPLVKTTRTGHVVHPPQHLSPPLGPSKSYTSLLSQLISQFR